MPKIVRHPKIQTRSCFLTPVIWSYSDHQKATRPQSEPDTTSLDKVVRDAGYPTVPEKLAEVLEVRPGGIGNGPTSCWISEATSAEERIFDVTIQSKGLKIFERDIPSRRENKKNCRCTESTMKK